MIYQGNAKYKIHTVVGHCSATRPKWMAGRSNKEVFAEIRRWHVEDNGWRDIGYHFVIFRDGSIMPGRAMTAIGSGVKGFNAGVIHVCLIGGFGSDADDDFADHFTKEQDASFRNLLADIMAKTGPVKVDGHNSYAAKACPGFRVSKWLAAQKAAA